MSGYKLGKKSLAELAGVEADLVRVVKRAIEITEQDFSVHDGVRTEAEQRENVRRGASKTMKSKHLEGRAVDLVPYINGQLRWEWPPIYRIAVAVQQARKELGVDLIWGGVWDKRMSEYGCDIPKEAETAVRLYTIRHPGPDLIDGPHFQLA